MGILKSRKDMSELISVSEDHSADESQESEMEVDSLATSGPVAKSTRGKRKRGKVEEVVEDDVAEPKKAKGKWKTETGDKSGSATVSFKHGVSTFTSCQSSHFYWLNPIFFMSVF